ncbi:invasion associated locus B family protein [Pseudahrensia aquimaris]|uniref:Invasion associated locus B family protein n=1 Tax=Pseudahrensia aquimaris TaxID=744461 RepID=A0ABW3FFW0_9HYPH
MMKRISLMKTSAFAGAMIAAAMTLPQAAFAQAPVPIKQHNAWGAYSYNDARAGKICYILSIPTVKAPADRDHGDVFFLVSQKPNKSGALEPQVEVGYPLKTETPVTVDIDGTKFQMFSQGNNAWVRDLAEEPKLVTAMRAGRSMTVSAESRRGTQTTYTYSLSGVTAALSEVNNCK